jgi:hypothetical protein
MPLSAAGAVAQAKDLDRIRSQEQTRLDLIHSYLRDDPNERRLGGLPEGTPVDVQRLARISRVNLLKFIVNSRVQSMYVDGFQTPQSPENVAQWTIWQRNKMDARQIGVHRAGLSFGASYVTVLPGRDGDVPVMRGASPRDLTVAYGDDDDWPAAGLERRRNGRWRLIDNEAVYWLRGTDNGFELTDDPQLHGATVDGEPVCPIVRFRDTDDLDDPVRGIVEPYLSLQDQINITTFGLMVAQHYGAFRQRYIMGWLAETEEKALKMGASRLMMFEDSPQDVQVGEFAQTDLRGYIESREASIRHMATVSQTPVHELLGSLINLNAAALEAAKASHYAAVGENRIMMGESHEQELNLAGSMVRIEPDPAASVIWQDTRVRSLSEAAAAFGDLVERLGVPARALWPLLPGVQPHQVEQWIALADAQADPAEELAALMDRQAGRRNGDAPDDVPVGAGMG